MLLRTLKTTSDFKRVRGGVRRSTQAFLIESKARPAGRDVAMGPRFGFTVTKKLGGAIVRNRIKRRLRAVVRGLEQTIARPDLDFVVVARPGALDQPFAELASDFRRAVAAIVTPSGAAADGAETRGPGRTVRAADNTPRNRKNRISSPKA